MATYYINADTGNDTTGDGSQGSPWLTLSKANSSSTSGDTIFCEDATNNYALTGSLTMPNKTIVGESKENVVISTNGVTLVLNINTGDNATLTIKNVTFADVRLTGDHNRLFISKAGSTLNIENCIFNTIFSNAIMGYGSGVYNVTSCLFYDFYVGSIIFQSTGDVYNISNNVFHFENDTAYFSNFVSSNGSTGNFINNIFVNSQGRTVDFKRGPFTIATMATNCLQGSFSDYPAGIGNLIGVDPLFIDSANRNYNLSPSSPCIDAGTLV